MVILTNANQGDRPFDLLHAQRILQWQAAHPWERDVWEIKDGEPYQFVNGELIGTANKGKGKKPNVQEEAKNEQGSL
jgi:hypothetical protein